MGREGGGGGTRATIILVRGGKLSIASLHFGLACHGRTFLCWYKVSINGPTSPPPVAAPGFSKTWSFLPSL